MKQYAKLLTAVCLCLLLSACGGAEKAEPTHPAEAIPFEEGQYYAVAFLGYDNIDALPQYSRQYLDDEPVPVYKLSEGECYLVIPRYNAMSLEIYFHELEPMQSALVHQSEQAGPFVLQCNVSDIFPDSTVRFFYQGEEIVFSPYFSLMDGSLQIGDRGLDITDE